MFSHILIPTDGSPLSVVAVEKAISLAADADAKITVVTVVSPFHTFSLRPEQVEETRAAWEKHARLHAADILTDAQLKAKARGVPCEVVQLEGEAAYEAIIEIADKRACDLIAMASHGRGGIAAVVLGSETLKVLTHSKIPVLVYR